MTDEIRGIDDIAQLLVSGVTDWSPYGDVYTNTKNDLTIFNYKSEAQFAGRWNFFETVSRGLILNNKTGEIVARAFDKFFNWNEGGRKGRGHIVNVAEKVDGSLGILIRVPNDFQYAITTRGSFDGEQAEWATRKLAEYHLHDLPYNITLLFEIVYPGNRIVVNYGDREELVLLAARNRFTGEYLPFFPDVYMIGQEHGFRLPHIFKFNDMTEIIAMTDHLPVDQEGYVVEFSDGSRWKIKGDAYREMHKMINSISFNNVLTAVENSSLEALLGRLPLSYQLEVNQLALDVWELYGYFECKVLDAWERAPKGTRKEFALWVQANAHEVASFLFAKFDNRVLAPLIFQTIRKLNVEERESILEGDTFR